MMTYDLIDIWRIHHPEKKSFTWTQKKPFIRCRLDFWLISNAVQDNVSKTDIIPAIKSDHSAITLLLTVQKNNHTVLPIGNSIPVYQKIPPILNLSLQNTLNGLTILKKLLTSEFYGT